MRRIPCVFLFLFLCLTPAFGAERLDGESLVLPTQDELVQMRRMNPDFTAYPDAQGIVWLKQNTFARHADGGMERTQLWVILGRQGLGDRWLTWNIPEPANGRVEVLEASIRAADTGTRVLDARPESGDGLTVVRFPEGKELPETFILEVAWRETLMDQLAFEGMVWLQEDLPVWEASVEARFPSGQDLAHRAFPQDLRPGVVREGEESVYTWRKINVAPFNPRGLDAAPRAGLAFSTRQGETGMIRLMRDAEAQRLPGLPPAAAEGFRRSQEEGMNRLLDWLRRQPEITAAEGASRPIPGAAPWTREEKMLLAHGWLKERGIEAPLRWRMPLEPNGPVCAGLLQGPILELPVIKGSRKTGDNLFYSMEGAPGAPFDPLIQGARAVGLSGEGRLVQIKIPVSKAAENRLSAIMNLKLDPQGMLSGRVRVLLRGSWAAVLLPSAGQYAPDQTVRELFPGLQGYDSAQIKKAAGALELSFNLTGKPGIGGSGQGLLAVLPAFRPRAVQALESSSVPLSLRFPFILEQELTIGLPDGGASLVSGGSAGEPGKIGYSESYKNKRRRLEAEARCTVGISSLNAADRGQLLRVMELWRNFSARPIPVRVK